MLRILVFVLATYFGAYQLPVHDEPALMSQESTDIVEEGTCIELPHIKTTEND